MFKELAPGLTLNVDHIETIEEASLPGRAQIRITTTSGRTIYLDGSYSKFLEGQMSQGGDAYEVNLR